MAEATTYTGGCHCGAVKYRVTTKLDTVVTCNCSICSKTGTLLVFAPVGQFELLTGPGALTDYQFGKKRVHHFFCNRCGIRSFSRGTAPSGAEMVALNVRCLEGVDVGALALRPFDGRSLPID